MKIVFVSKYFLPFGAGLALGDTAFIDKTTKNMPYVIMHELAHLIQWNELGTFKFLTSYFGELIKNGYEKNSFEIEAREFGYRNMNMNSCIKTLKKHNLGHIISDIKWV